MPTCSTCKWWDYHRGNMYGVCTLAAWREDGTNPLALAVPDDGNVRAALLTRPGFGCVQHKEKRDAADA